MTQGIVYENMARQWLGTPYIHQASNKGQGADCLGLVRGIWRELGFDEPKTIPVYSPDWSEPSKKERLWNALDNYLVRTELDLSNRGSVLLFRMQQGSVAKHLGILAQYKSNHPSVLHAYNKRGVVETVLSRHWTDKIVAQYNFPEGRS